MRVLTCKVFNVLVILFSLLLTLFGTKLAIAENHPLQDTFLLTGAKLQEVNVAGWIMLNSSYLEEDDLNNILRKVVINMPSELKRTETKKNSGKYYNGITLSADLNNDIRIFISIESISHMLNSIPKDETYLAINISQFGDRVSLNDAEGLVKGILQNFGQNGQIASCLTGRINGKLGKVSKNKIIRKIVTKLNLSIVQQDINDDAISLLAYSPFIENSINLKGHAININLASRYDELKNQTEIYIGSPIIAVDF